MSKHMSGTHRLELLYSHCYGGISLWAWVCGPNTKNRSLEEAPVSGGTKSRPGSSPWEQREGAGERAGGSDGQWSQLTVTAANAGQLIQAALCSARGRHGVLQH